MGRELSRVATQIAYGHLYFAVSGEPVGFIIRRFGAEQVSLATVLHQPTAF